MVSLPTFVVLAALRSFLLVSTTRASHDTDCNGSGVNHSTYSYQDDVRPSSSSPLPLAETPQFVSLTNDDNGYSGLNGVGGGVDWLVKMLATRVHPSDKSPVLASFFFTTVYIEKAKMDDPVLVKRAWRDAMQAGHEVALHSHTHESGTYYDQKEWSNQINQCIDWLTKPWDPSEQVGSPNPEKGIGADTADVVGWRTPRLEYNDALFDALRRSGVWYDTSIQDGWQNHHDGTNYHWPYTLDRGSPGHDVMADWGLLLPMGSHPGLWEFPKHPFIVPTDDVAAQYGIPKGLRAKCVKKQSWFSLSAGKITGSDYNLIVLFGMTGPEFLATLKHTFNLHYENNRAPFNVGIHSDIYSDEYEASGVESTPKERREALSDFIDYVLRKPDVRMTTAREVLRWMRDPVPKECFGGTASGEAEQMATKKKKNGKRRHKKNKKQQRRLAY